MAEKRIEGNTSELIKKVRRIELKTRGLSKQIFSGEYQSSFKGRGMAFSEVREYSAGDEIRTIDWNVTARFNEPYVKVFEEEREISAILMVDVSASDNFGTTKILKRELIAEIAAVISFSALQNNDKIGVILFSDKVEKFIPPKKGKSHVLRIVRELLEFQPENTGTDINVAFEYLNKVQKKRSICFLLSDFIAPINYTQSVKVTGKRHDLIALQIFDEKEIDLPRAGLMNVRDPETGEQRWINTSSKRQQKHYKQQFLDREFAVSKLLKSAKVDYAKASTSDDYVKVLLQLFKQRSR